MSTTKTGALGLTPNAPRDHEKPREEFSEKSPRKSTPPSPEALRFCLEDTGRQIADSIEEAHARGLRAPTEEEREARRFDLAEHLLAADDDELRAVARRFLVIPERGAA